MRDISDILIEPGEVQIVGAPAGYDALVLAEAARTRGSVLFVARDDVRMAAMIEALGFFAPNADRIDLPAWDCLPYDRASPNPDIVARRVDALTRLLTPAEAGIPRIVLTTISALLQRVPPPASFADASLTVDKGTILAIDDLVEFLEGNGYVRSDTVREPGEYAVRGGIVDMFAAGHPAPVRVDFFGDEVDGIRAFDPADQRTTDTLNGFCLKPANELVLTPDAVARFRTGYRELFGASADDPLYTAVSEGRRPIGVEHWIALFHDKLATLFDYTGDGPIILDPMVDEARDARLDLIAEYYTARVEVSGKTTPGAPPYHPVPPERLYMSPEELVACLSERPVGRLSPFAQPEAAGALDLQARPGRDFADARVRPDVNVFDAVKDRIATEQGEGRRVMISAFSHGTRERLLHVLEEHGQKGLTPVTDWKSARSLPKQAIAVGIMGVEQGFSGPDLAVIAEQDILGERLSRPGTRRVTAENFIAEASSLNVGDLVVHIDHGIGRFDGLVTVEAGGAPHDCLTLIYHGDDKLFVPVENIEVLTRYGSEDTGAQLDRLGGAAWQARKARMKARIRDMADDLIKVAAARTLKPAPVMVPPDGLFEEFCARFPFQETEDQLRAIEATLGDMQAGRSTDRLVCGDVGFGKTEVALRAAFVAALSGKQVAIVVPTTLLARQHHQNFKARFEGLPVRIAQLSRLVSAKDVKATKEEMAKGTVEIVIGTHALLAKDVRFADLGLLVIDEEQHFGVKHKERLKQMKSDVHVLTLTATPIPRTLQLALSGVREMSLIATPPVDRLAVRTFVLPFDPVIVREAIMRERFRGGQVFYVCPRIEDLAPVEETLRELVPEAKIVVVHGQMSAKDLEAAMTAFHAGAFDILLSTNIVESGLDLPTVNTIVIHRADRFGLAQLYQLRGRVGRSKVRAYAYLTLPPGQSITKGAEKRLEVMQTLDTLGAGFSLASHDLDIRGAGNLLGEEQSGHIREVGIELYQQMLEEAVAEARGMGEVSEGDWSPQINVGMAVLIPEHYVTDLPVRMSLYRRIATLADDSEIEAFAAELIDRFGSLPPEVETLLKVVSVKRLCLKAGIAKIDAGPKGAVVAFRNDTFVNPEGLIKFITDNVGTVKVRPDQKLVLMRAWERAEDRLVGAARLAADLAGIASG